MQAGETGTQHAADAWKGALPDDAPLVTITKRGAIILNRPAYVALSYAQGIELLYDAQRRVLGLRAVPMTQAGAYWVVQRRDGAAFGPQRHIEAWAIHAAAFLERFGIAPATRGTFPTAMSADILTVHLRPKRARHIPATAVAVPTAKPTANAATPNGRSVPRAPEAASVAPGLAFLRVVRRRFAAPTKEEPRE